MNPYSAYQQQKNHSMPRIELTLALFRKALDNLNKARAALVEQRADAARPLLLNTQLIVASMTAELPAYEDDAARNFQRLYEFVAHQMTHETIASVDAAAKVLRTLQEGFEAVREQALELEAQGAIPSLRDTQGLSLSA